MDASRCGAEMVRGLRRFASASPSRRTPRARAFQKRVNRIDSTMTGRLRLGVLLVLVCASTGAAPQTPAQSPPPVPAPGRLVDLGGWRLHLHCTGEEPPSQPTVILEAGAAGLS